MIRVRFAPSPTGNLHIGGVRTALFNYLYARSQQGAFLLRIEDTDRERSRPEFEEEILSSLKWLGLEWDEEPLKQSGRLERYREAAEVLLRSGAAYEQSKDGKTAVFLRVPAGEIQFTDAVHGPLKFDTGLFGDLVVIKSDGYPTYHFACVVDDHDSGITHVLRGDDHLSNTPKHLCLFEALGWKPPKYAHLPLILGSDGQPLSKRHGTVAASHYRALGFLPEAVLNYLALLGWRGEDDQEIYTPEDLKKKFSLKRLNKAGAVFDFEKLSWINAQHLKKKSEAEYLAKLTEFYEKESGQFSPEVWRRVALLYRSRFRFFSDFREQASYLFSEVENYETATRDLYLKNRTLKAHLNAWLEKVSELENFDDDKRLESLTREIAEGWGIEARDLIHPLRFAVTGRSASPGLFELMSVLGKEKCLSRLRRFISLAAGIAK